MATSKKRPASSTETTFVGAAQEKFDSFLELATFTLDTNCHNWRNYQAPQSYVIPPIYYYKHPDKSDEIHERAKEELALASQTLQKGDLSKAKPEEFAIVKDRGADEAEHIVFRAIERLIQEKVQAPIIAIQNLNINKIKHLLKDLFPSLEWRHLKSSLLRSFDQSISPFQTTGKRNEIVDKFEKYLTDILPSINGDTLTFSNQIQQKLQDVSQSYGLQATEIAKIKASLIEVLNNHFREYDFVLIGPKIGIIVIEVKHSSFTQNRHFSSGNKHLPEDYWKGLQQVQSFDLVLDTLEDCVGLKLTKDIVRKVLFTPNLRKHRLLGWLKAFDADSKTVLNERLKFADFHWFAEDLVESSETCHLPSIYGTLAELVRSGGNDLLSRNLFELCCPVFVGLSSVTTIKTRAFALMTDKISESLALLKESHRIETSDPSGKLLKKDEIVTTAIPKRRKKDSYAHPLSTIKLINKSIILTPEQKAALEGPNRQYIIGPAGTGKTIIILAKALELLKEGKSVYVFTSPHFASTYKQLFEGNGFTKFEMSSSWQELRRGFFSFKEIINSKEDIPSCVLKFTHDTLADSVRAKRLRSIGLMRLLSNFDAVFIDDVSDRYAWDLGIDEISPSSREKLSDITADVLLGLMQMALAYVEYPSKTLWYALDSWINKERYHFLKDDVGIQKLVMASLNRGMELGDSYYAITKLNRVMRCPENVFQAAYNSGGQFRPAVKPQLGHKIQGKSKQIQIKCNDENQGMELVWEEIKKCLNMADVSKVCFDHICIILSAAWEVPILAFLFQKCENDGIPAVIPVQNRPLKFEYTSSFGSSALADKGKLTIYRSHIVSSAEWPIVIFADYRDPDRYHRKIDFIRDDYRARTRATAELIEITAVCTSRFGKLYRSLSDSFASYNDYIQLRSPFKKFERKQLGNMAGSAESIADLALLLGSNYQLHRSRHIYSEKLFNWTRRRHYTVADISLEKRHSPLPLERRKQKDFGFAGMFV